MLSKPVSVVQEMTQKIRNEDEQSLRGQLIPNTQQHQQASSNWIHQQQQQRIYEESPPAMHDSTIYQTTRSHPGVLSSMPLSNTSNPQHHTRNNTSPVHVHTMPPRAQHAPMLSSNMNQPSHSFHPHYMHEYAPQQGLSIHQPTHSSSPNKITSSSSSTSAPSAVHQQKINLPSQTSMNNNMHLGAEQTYMYNQHPHRTSPTYHHPTTSHVLEPHGNHTSVTNRVIPDHRSHPTGAGNAHHVFGNSTPIHHMYERNTNNRLNDRYVSPPSPSALPAMTLPSIRQAFDQVDHVQNHQFERPSGASSLMNPSTQHHYPQSVPYYHNTAQSFHSSVAAEETPYSYQKPQHSFANIPHITDKYRAPISETPNSELYILEAQARRIKEPRNLNGAPSSIQHQENFNEHDGHFSRAGGARASSLLNEAARYVNHEQEAVDYNTSNNNRSRARKSDSSQETDGKKHYKKKGPKKREISREDMKKYFNVSQTVAAHLLGVSVSTLKRRYVVLICI